jgi:hypothetical protein
MEENQGLKASALEVVGKEHELKNETPVNPETTSTTIEDGTKALTRVREMSLSITRRKKKTTLNLHMRKLL